MVMATSLCHRSCLSGTAEAGQSRQDCIGRSLLHLGGPQHRTLGTLCNSSQAFPVHYFFPSCSRSQPSLAQTSLACPAATLCLQNCLARLGLDEGISQGLVEAEEGKVSLVLSLSKALAFESLLQARDQPAMALLRLWLNRLCMMAFLTLCVFSLLSVCLLCGDICNTLAQQALQLIPVFGDMKCWECSARAREVSCHTKVPQKHMHPSGDRARLGQI